MKFYINDREVEAREGQSILDAALEAGIFIPHLCSHPDLEAKGGQFVTYLVGGSPVLVLLGLQTDAEEQVDGAVEGG